MGNFFVRPASLDGQEHAVVGAGRRAPQTVATTRISDREREAQAALQAQIRAREELERQQARNGNTDSLDRQLHASVGTQGPQELQQQRLNQVASQRLYPDQARDVSSRYPAPLQREEGRLGGERHATVGASRQPNQINGRRDPRTISQEDLLEQVREEQRRNGVRNSENLDTQTHVAVGTPNEEGELRRRLAVNSSNAPVGRRLS